MSFHPYLWNYVNLYLDTVDIDSFQGTGLVNYYKNLIRDFLNSEFKWDNGPPQGMEYKKVSDLPKKLKVDAVDCLGVILGIGPKAKFSATDGGISFLYVTYLRYYSEFE